MKMYGIPNCDTVKKARKYLETHQLAYDFHDFKKQGLDIALLESWLQFQPLEKLVNKRSTSWKQLDDAQKTALLNGDLNVLLTTPTLIKRPVLVSANDVIIGFDEKAYEALPG
ncbi:Spx/MgsR family RNA polymerase-binding regulatory protein [Thiomicrorhabdus cannonii]|uniref:Spx/MgsR family RNA polymerase-binding regulatory protein n=1 Tax=Thiomicrorhabdus cannonii TaxID=2748011 RepID=UPI0015C06D98|nr:Spx/MgsR family RNA polymerase-binding regulatory protein [Thiomicrorhabdus cannonii]